MITMSQNSFDSVLCLGCNVSYPQSLNALISRLIIFTRGGGSCHAGAAQKPSEHPPSPFSAASLGNSGMQLVSSRCTYLSQYSCTH